MPAGVSWGIYLRFASAAMLSMFAGSQMVHHIYHPLADLERMVKEEKAKMLEEQNKQKDLVNS